VVCSQSLVRFSIGSHAGWSIWNIILDFTGGTLSDVQLVLDCAALKDWTGITGNLTKLALGSVSVVFDLMFMAQHYILYPNNSNSNNNASNPQREDDGDESEDNAVRNLLQGERLPALDVLL